MAFVKGQSGNPSGRPKNDLMGVQAMQAVARGAAPAILKRWIEIATSDEVKPEIALRAGELVMNRAYGTPRTDKDAAGSRQLAVMVLPLPAPSAEAWEAKYGGSPVLIEASAEQQSAEEEAKPLEVLDNPEGEVP